MVGESTSNHAMESTASRGTVQLYMGSIHKSVSTRVSVTRMTCLYSKAKNGSKACNASSLRCISSRVRDDYQGLHIWRRSLVPNHTARQ